MTQDPLREARVNALLDTIENAYHFECEAGPLKNCGEWKALKRALAATEGKT